MISETKEKPGEEPGKLDREKKGKNADKQAGR